MTATEFNFNHLAALTDDRGIFEHAEYAVPRPEHGYCVDDVARALIVLERARTAAPRLRAMMLTYLRFLADAQSDDGQFTNRCDVAGVWHGVPDVADHWGRALWALGTVVANDPDPHVAAEALRSFELGSHHRTISLRAMMWAALGAAEVLRAHPLHGPSMAVLDAASSMVPEATAAAWPWPEARLTYANAIVPEVLMLAGHHLGRPGLLARGVTLLHWLVDNESVGEAFSVTSVGGWGPGEARVTFDQQSIEVAALVDACATAVDLTGDAGWLVFIDRGYAWFDGVNDAKTSMFNESTGAGFDGLTALGRNENQGAESTVCYLSVAERHRTYIGERTWDS